MLAEIHAIEDLDRVVGGTAKAGCIVGAAFGGTTLATMAASAVRPRRPNAFVPLGKLTAALVAGGLAGGGIGCAAGAGPGALAPYISW